MPKISQSKTTIKDNEIHVWSANIDQPNSVIQELTQTLSEDELKRADRFYFDKHKNRFITCRGILRNILGNYLEIAPEKIQFCYSDRGKPALLPNNNNLYFNLSHSENMAVYAMTRKLQIGVDIEYIRPITDAEEIAKRFFSESEYKLIQSLPENQKQLAFFNCWTRKEAYIKAIGQGLAYSLDKIEVSLIPGESPRIISIGGDTNLANNWSIYELKLNNSYAAALAIEENNCCLLYREWI